MNKSVIKFDTVVILMKFERLSNTIQVISIFRDFVNLFVWCTVKWTENHIFTRVVNLSSHKEYKRCIHFIKEVGEKVIFKRANFDAVVTILLYK